MTKTTIQQALSTYESHAQTLRSSVASAEVELEAWTAIANDLAGQHATAKDIATTWVVTIPGAALVAIQAYALLHLFVGVRP